MKALRGQVPPWFSREAALFPVGKAPSYPSGGSACDALQLLRAPSVHPSQFPPSHLGRLARASASTS